MPVYHSLAIHVSPPYSFHSPFPLWLASHFFDISELGKQNSHLDASRRATVAC